MQNRTHNTGADKYARPIPYAERIAVTNKSRPAASVSVVLYIVLALLILFAAFFASRITADSASIFNDTQPDTDSSINSAFNNKQPDINGSSNPTFNNKQHGSDALPASISANKQPNINSPQNSTVNNRQPDINSPLNFELSNRQQRADDPVTSITIPKGGSPAIALIQLSGPSLPMTVSFLDSADVKKNITADSATIISPRVRSVLSADTVLYEIEPKLPVDSVMLFVRHSQAAVDTLGVFSSPPFRAVWNRADVPDQDQIHIQFGYVLYCPDSVVITSPALPHRWALGRGLGPSKKSYKIKQLPTSALAAFGVDCDTSKWADVESGRIGGVARFKLLWSSAKLLFIAEVKDKSVTPGDFVELHLDFNRDRSHFAGVNHRSFRFGPRMRTTSFVVELNDSGFVYCDSVNALINEDMARKYVLTPDGYVVEAAIPFSLISNRDFPKSKIGFDVTVMDVDEGGGDTSFYSWASAGRFTRYSPRVWGEARVTQAALALKIVFIFVLLAGAVGITAFFVHGIVNAAKERGQDEAEADMYAQLSESVAAHIKKDHDTDDDEDGD